MEALTDFLQNLKDNIAAVIAILASLGIVIDATPFIKIQPFRSLGRWIRKVINKDVMEELKDLKIKVEKSDRTISAHIIESQRQEILEFANSCIRGEMHTKDEYDHIFEIHTEYLKATSENNIENGKLDVAYRVIEDSYLDNIHHNRFLTYNKDMNREIGNDLT